MWVRLIFSWPAAQEVPADGEPADGEAADGVPAVGVPADGEAADGDAVLGDDAAAGAFWLAHPAVASPHAAMVRTPKAIVRGSRTT